MEKVNLYVDREKTRSPYFRQTLQNVSKKVAVEVNPPRLENKNICVNLNPKESFHHNEASMGYFNDKNSSFIKDHLTVVLETHNQLGVLSPFTEEELHHRILTGEFSPNLTRKKNGVSIDIYDEYDISHEILEKIEENIAEINLYSDTKILPKVPYSEGLKIRQFIKKERWTIKNQWKFENKFLNLQYKDEFVQFLGDAINLATRFVLLDEEYDITNIPKNLDSEKINKLENIISITEKFYELIQFGMKYTKFILEDSQKDHINFNEIKKSQDTIENITGQISNLSSNYLFFTIPEQYLLSNLKFIPPGSISEMALNQHDAFETTSLIVQVYFDLLKNFKNRISPEKIFPC